MAENPKELAKSRLGADGGVFWEKRWGKIASVIYTTYQERILPHFLTQFVWDLEYRVIW